MTTNGLSLGHGTLKALRQSLLSHASDQAISVLQETGFASGDGVFQAFGDWLRVQHAIAELGYRRNSSARALATRRTRTLGVVAGWLCSICW